MNREKLLLVDGNSMLFRAYYATSYNNIMKTSSGIYTNAVFAFANMLKKAINSLEPKYVAVCFDKGKHTFRHDLASDYKGGRKETPQELVMQFSLVRDYLKAYPIIYLEEDDIEADDLIGSLANHFQDVDVIILSSDKDLLQLIDGHVSVYLMKKGISDMVLMNEESLYEDFELKPKQIIDLKALMGDSSDNIKGVKNVGQKTATKLLRTYESVDNIYEHIDEIKGKVKEYLINDKEQCFLSKKLATIITDFKIDIPLDSLELHADIKSLNEFYKKYEMHSLINHQTTKVEIKYDIVKEVSASLFEDKPVIYFESDEFSYYDRKIYGVAISNGEKNEYIEFNDFLMDENFLDFLNSDKEKIVYDSKLIKHNLERLGYDLNLDSIDDMMIMAFLDNNYLDNLESIFDYFGLDRIDDISSLYGTIKKPLSPSLKVQASHATTCALRLKKIYKNIYQDLVDKDILKLYLEIEKPLIKVLQKMEKTGIICDSDILDNIAQEALEKMNELAFKIYGYAGFEFNLNSPKQLAEVLFDNLGLPDNKKHSTSIEVLMKLHNYHPIIDDLIEYRKYSKLYSTYAEGLKKYIQSDNKIHTIFSQTITQTGRLSSYDPNLQNISVKDEDSKMIRKAFKARDKHVLISSDYSQIELRVLASLSEEERMIEAFNEGIDIHTKTAMDVFHIPFEEVDSHIRRQAKAINFGVVYGISDFGLSKQASLSIKEAKHFIEEYFRTYPKIKEYMDKQVEFCKENGYVKTMMNRRRYIKEINDANYMTKEFGKRAAMNSPIQGSAADLIKMAMIRIDALMEERNLKSKMILQVHDELIFDVAEDEIDIMKEIITNGMANAYKLRVALSSSLAMGKTWYEAK